jgi:hypothetical protein
MPTMDEVTKAYLAGIMDGEGSISLAVHTTRKTKEGRPATSPKLLVQISGTDEALIRWIYKTIGGGHVVVGYRPKRPHHKTAYSWRAWGEVAAIFLEAILPYMRVKTEQAKLGLRAHKMKGPAGIKLGTKEMEFRLSLREEMIKLNGRRLSNGELKSSVTVE